MDKDFYLNLLRWFKSQHPGFSDIVIECPEINLIEEPGSNHNTDEDGDPEIEKQYEGSVYYFTSSNDPNTETSVYKTTKSLALALLERRAAPTLVIQGGNLAQHKQSSQLENVVLIQFPFGSGGPTLKRRTKISDEVLLRHYLRLSLPQFMRSEFVLLANHMLNRILSYKSALLKCRPIIDDNGTAMGVEIAKMSVEDVKEAVKDEQETDRKMDDAHVSRSKGKSVAKKFLQAVRASCRAMGHTKEAAEYARRKCFALQKDFGLHRPFFTITSNDECSF